MVVDNARDDKDFEFHLQAPQNGERKVRGTQFVTVFADKVAESIAENQRLGFDCKDRGKTQPNGQSCLIASIVACARGMGTASIEFAPSVDQLFARAQQMGIVDRFGIDPRRASEITLLATEVGLQPEFKNYYPNDMSVTDIDSLANIVVEALKISSGIAVLIPASKHYVLLHGVSKDGMRVYDPLTGSDETRTFESVATNIGNIVNGEMVGERYTGNGFIVLNSAKKSDDDFVIHART